VVEREAIVLAAKNSDSARRSNIRRIVSSYYSSLLVVKSPVLRES
jgi:hypothetical protein